ncbi:MAG: hypothetical protein RI911_790 [Candidatus Parcubacteria bacterium]|jgi:hypothetical protein
MELLRRHTDILAFALMICLLAVAFLIRSESSARDSAIWTPERQYYQDEGFFPLAVGEIAGEEGVFVDDEYQGMAVHVQTPGSLPGRTLMLMISDETRVYPREYICAGQCDTLKDGYVYWREYMALTHKQDCKDPQTDARHAYCNRYKEGRRYTFWGTMQQKEGNTSQHVLGEVKVIVEE